MYGLSVEPFDFQREGVQFALSHKYCIIADSMGLGKTLQAIAVANHTKSKCLVVCPAFLKLTWVQEIEKLSSDPKHIHVYKKALDIYSYAPQLDDFVIINYEQIRHAESLFRWADMVVTDEGHYLKNPDAQRTVLFDKYLYESEAKRYLLLTGTPIQNRVEELYQLITMVEFDPKAEYKLSITRDFPTKEKFCDKFSNRITMRINGRYVVKWEGVRNTAELKKYLVGKMIRRLQEEVHELPEMVEKEVVVSYKQDKSLAKEFENHSRGLGKDITAKEKSARLKAKFTIKYVQGLIEDGVEQLVVFSDHVKPAEEIAEAFGVSAVTGKMPKEKRMDIVNGFQAGDIKIFVATIGAASTGLTLTAASNLVFNDLNWVPGNNAQAKKRIHRIGQNSKCVLHYIVGSFQDAYIKRNLIAKEKSIKEVVR